MEIAIKVGLICGIFAGAICLIYNCFNPQIEEEVFTKKSTKTILDRKRIPILIELGWDNVKGFQLTSKLLDFDLRLVFLRMEISSNKTVGVAELIEKSSISRIVKIAYKGTLLDPESDTYKGLTLALAHEHHPNNINFEMYMDNFQKELAEECKYINSLESHN